MSSKKDQNEILNYFEYNKILPLEPGVLNQLSVPDKNTSFYSSKMGFSSALNQNFSKKNSDPNYDSKYLSTAFDVMHKHFERPVPLEHLADGSNFAFPSKNRAIEIESYSQLDDEESSKDFANKIFNFPETRARDNERVQVFYLIGYVGSGKTTFLDFLRESRKGEFQDELVVNVSYTDFTRKHYDDLDENSWREKISEKIVRRVIREYDLVTEHSDIDPTFNTFEQIVSILSEYNLVLFLDGFDSLSVNRVETQNAKHIIGAINLIVESIGEIYSEAPIGNKRCNLIYSLRKCTFEATSNRGRLPVPFEAYFFNAPEFEEVLATTAFKLGMYEEVPFFRNDSFRNLYIELTKTCKKRIEEVLLPKGDCLEDVFDNNVRRMFRYISCVVAISAIRLANSPIIDAAPRTSEMSIHEYFLDRLNSNLKTTPRHIFVDILVYGPNYSYNNYFSDKKEYDNLPGRSGFVDNLFNYMEDQQYGASNGCSQANLLKYRILEFLAGYKDEKTKDSYISIDAITRLDLWFLRQIAELDLIEALTDLEKALFVRTSNSQAQSAGEDEGRSKKLLYKCSNFGKFVINNIAPEFSYLSAVCQNTIIPSGLSEEISYVSKHSSSLGRQFFLSRTWAKNIIPYTLMFLRYLKSIESASKEGDSHISQISAMNCKDAIENILSSKSKILSNAVREEIARHCFGVSGHKTRLVIGEDEINPKVDSWE